jgi:hypothetical protein
VTDIYLMSREKINIKFILICAFLFTTCSTLIIEIIFIVILDIHNHKLLVFSRLLYVKCVNCVCVLLYYSSHKVLRIAYDRPI